MLAIIKVQAEQEIESEKLDSPRPLDADIIDDDSKKSRDAEAEGQQ